MRNLSDANPRNYISHSLEIFRKYFSKRIVNVHWSWGQVKINWPIKAMLKERVIGFSYNTLRSVEIIKHECLLNETIKGFIHYTCKKKLFKNFKNIYQVAI